MERVYHLYKSIYTSKFLSLNLKPRHYSTVVRPSVLYASECMNMVRKGQLRTEKSCSVKKGGKYNKE